MPSSLLFLLPVQSVSFLTPLAFSLCRPCICLMSLVIRWSRPLRTLSPTVRKCIRDRGRVTGPPPTKEPITVSLSLAYFHLMRPCKSCNRNSLPLDGGGKGGGEYHPPPSPPPPPKGGGRNPPTNNIPSALQNKIGLSLFLFFL